MHFLMRKLLLVCFLAVIASALPSNYDLRAQNDIIRYANYGLQLQGICSGYSWAKQLAQIVGNAVGLQQQQKLSLSAQHILDCTQTQTDICDQATLSNIYAGIKRIQKEGVTTTKCYPNKPFSFPNKYCKRQCFDGSFFPEVYIPIIKKINGLEDISNLFKQTEKIAIMAIVKVDASFNYYSPFNAKLTEGGPKQNDIYEYRIGEIVGWKNYYNSPKLILRVGSGSQWGYYGFIDLELSKYANYIEGYYSVLSEGVNKATQ